MKYYIYAGSTTDGHEYWMEIDDTKPSTTAAKVVEFGRINDDPPVPPPYSPFLPDPMYPSPPPIDPDYIPE